ncbi:hypothetical protein K438DRAFT_1762452 [Mycena galopus ATCC 62051]|nr:hypothetical protein K438DRAFT_1762452 [Mycena galopus ATCC 62051]
MYHPTTIASVPTPSLMDYIDSLNHASQLQTSGVMAHYDLGRISFLCKCGYDHRQRNTKYNHTRQAEPGSKKPHMLFPFNGCLAHAEITIRGSDVLRIRGHFQHNDECKTANIACPPFPFIPPYTSKSQLNFHYPVDQAVLNEALKEFSAKLDVYEAILGLMIRVGDYQSPNSHLDSVSSPVRNPARDIEPKRGRSSN